MIAAAKRAGLAYVAITDHASSMGMVRGIKMTNAQFPMTNARRKQPLTKSNLDEYIKRVRAAAAKVPGIHVLAGAEVDIRADGSLYLPDAALQQLDWVIGAIHQGFKQDRGLP